MVEPLSSQAERAADLVWAYRLGEYPADRLAKELSMPRHEAVWILKELEEAGHGRFVVGRREHPSRFIRGVERPPKADESGSPAREPSSEGPASGAQTLVLMRPTPVKIVVPADLTRTEADRISRWLDVIVHE